MINIEDLMQKFCDAGARAVRRYIDVSGLDPWNIPEYFMPALILNDLGDHVTATLESNFNDLSTWNANIRTRNRLPQQEKNEKLLLISQHVSPARRVDMVVYSGQQENKPKDQQDITALIEFKRGYIDSMRLPARISDRDKLLIFLHYIDTCPWGVVCGWIPQNHYDWQKQTDIQGTKDRWFESTIQLPEHKAPLFFCARLFARGSDQERLDELSATIPESS